ncbi:MAG: hypothetical protein LBH20_03915 [Treponema sp.]|jgi:hypothetical protein|nr:hypothetical protein [Treponema sp.]
MTVSRAVSIHSTIKVMNMVKRISALLCFFYLAFPLWAQTASPAQHEEPISFVGMKVDELIRRFGSPQTVYTARGTENWQDDVVFVYNEGDFYIYRDRVWQVGLKSVYGIRVGDFKAVAMLVLGEGAQDKGDYVLYPLGGNAWPLSLCVNFNADKISAIFVYRPDY